MWGQGVGRPVGGASRPHMSAFRDLHQGVAFWGHLESSRVVSTANKRN
jgi:hypothetical protein